jgi:hypothetical protein
MGTSQAGGDSDGSPPPVMWPSRRAGPQLVPGMPGVRYAFARMKVDGDCVERNGLLLCARSAAGRPAWQLSLKRTRSVVGWLRGSVRVSPSRWFSSAERRCARAGIWASRRLRKQIVEPPRCERAFGPAHIPCAISPSARDAGHDGAASLSTHGPRTLLAPMSRM